MANKTQVTYSANAIASGTTGTETAITLRKSSNFSATSTAVSFALTASKTFVITSMVFSARGHATATLQATTFNFRLNPEGAVTTSTTPILFSVRVATPTLAGGFQSVSVPMSEGYEIFGDGTLQFGVTANAVFTTNAPTWDVLIIGYEY